MSDVGQRQVMFEYITDIDKTVRQHYAGTIDEEKLRAALTKGYVEGLAIPMPPILRRRSIRRKTTGWRARTADWAWSWR